MAKATKATKAAATVNPVNSGKDGTTFLGKVGQIVQVTAAQLTADAEYTGRMVRSPDNIRGIAASILEKRAEFIPPIKVKADGTVVDGETRRLALAMANNAGVLYEVKGSGEGSINLPPNPKATLPALIVPDDIDVRKLQQESNAHQEKSLAKDKLREIWRMIDAGISLTNIALTYRVDKPIITHAKGIKDETADTIELLANEWLQLAGLADVVWVKADPKNNIEKHRRFSVADVERHLRYIAGLEKAGTAFRTWKANEYAVGVWDDKTRKDGTFDSTFTEDENGHPNTRVTVKPTIATMLEKLRESTDKTHHLIAYAIQRADAEMVSTILNDGEEADIELDEKATEYWDAANGEDGEDE